MFLNELNSYNTILKLVNLTIFSVSENSNTCKKLLKDEAKIKSRKNCSSVVLCDYLVPGTAGNKVEI